MPRARASYLCKHRRAGTGTTAGAAMARRTLTADEKRVVGARQRWRCSDCRELLPPAYEVDHTVPLHASGRDTIDNCTAMCANCHALKSLRERMPAADPAAAAARYAAREDTVSGGLARCSLCGAVRPDTCLEHVCSEIETPGARGRALLASLSRFAFAPRHAGHVAGFIRNNRAAEGRQ